MHFLNHMQLVCCLNNTTADKNILIYHLWMYFNIFFDILKFLTNIENSKSCKIEIKTTYV